MIELSSKDGDEKQPEQPISQGETERSCERKAGKQVIKLIKPLLVAFSAHVDDNVINMTKEAGFDLCLPQLKVQEI